MAKKKTNEEIANEVAENLMPYATGKVKVAESVFESVSVTETSKSIPEKTAPVRKVPHKTILKGKPKLGHKESSNKRGPRRYIQISVPNGTYDMWVKSDNPYKVDIVRAKIAEILGLL